MKGKMECRKHNHQGNKGVCPSCLRDKLSLLPYSTTTAVRCHVSILSPSLSSSSSSASPAALTSHRRAGSMSFAVSEALSDFHGAGLKKSRSMAFAPREYVAGELKKKKKKTTTVKKVGFWTKLLPLRSKAGGPDGGLFHTRPRFHY